MYNLEELKNMEHSRLVNLVYNQEVCAFEEDEQIKKFFNNDKPIPYLGWFWRSTDFYNKNIPIGFSNLGYVGVMENNKWDYDERNMTYPEANQLIEYLDRAMDANGEVEEVIKILTELNNWMQTLKFKE